MFQERDRIIDCRRNRDEPSSLFPSVFRPRSIVPRCFNGAAAYLFRPAKGAVMTQWYFVWVEGARGPTPQKWSSDGLWGQIGRQDIVVRFSLSDREAELSLDELARLYPVPITR
jgi:hypothetical protein